jgi:hypothetical protein
MNSTDNDHAHPSGPSRRTFLGAAGALGVAGAAFPLLGASAAEASRTARATGAAAAARGVADTRTILPFAGANWTVFQQMQLGKTDAPTAPALTPPPTGFRRYLDDTDAANTNGYATAVWPTAPNGSPAHGIVSIRPDINMLLNGDFDADLHAFMVSAPGGPASLLTMWHECATHNLTKPWYPQNPELFTEGLTHLQNLASGHVAGYASTDVKVGVIDVNPSAIPLAKYPFGPKFPAEVYIVWQAPNLDWYGCDLYDNGNFNLSVYDELNAYRTIVNNLPLSITGADWPINLPECNSAVPADQNKVTSGNSATGYRRSDFFHYAWAWLNNIGPASHCGGLLGFWDGSGNEGSNWPPDDTADGMTALVAELQNEFGASSP